MSAMYACMLMADYYYCTYHLAWLLYIQVFTNTYIEQFQKVITVINITRKMVLSNNLSLCRLFALVFCLSH